MEDLNLLSEELLEQIFVYLIDINWEEDQIDEILDQIWEIEEELELKDNLILLPNFPYINTYLEDYKYLVIYVNHLNIFFYKIYQINYTTI